jgi:ribosomal protein S18 acetylase RimI-like enzyme
MTHITAHSHGSIDIRSYSENMVREHIDDILQIEQEAFVPFSPPYDVWDLDNFLYKLPNKEKLSFLLYDTSKDKLIGFIISSSYGDATHLNRVAVSENYQGKSLGKLLVDKFLEESKALGFKMTTLSTLNDPEHDYVIKFYEKMGYRLLTEKKEITHFLEKKGKPHDFELFYPPNEAGKLLVMEKQL